MRAAVYHGPRDVRIEMMPEPAAPGPGEVVLAVLASSICGTDVSEYQHGPLMIPLREQHRASGHCGPTIMGHEFAGRVVAVGEGVGLAEGSRVAVGAGMWCGRCRWCMEGRPNLCKDYFVFGLHAHGGLAEFVKVPAKMCHIVPDGCRDEWAALAQPCAIALHAVRRSGAGPEDTVVLMGVGGIGSFMLAALRAMNVATIIALDVDERRLATARRLGATMTLRVEDDTRATISAVRDLTSGNGVDIVIEASGAPQSSLLALSLARRGGRLLQAGLPAEPLSLPLRQMVVPEIDMITTNGHVCDIDLPQALALLATTNLAPTILDRVIALDNLEEGLLALAERRARGKIVVTLQ